MSVIARMKCGKSVAAGYLVNLRAIKPTSAPAVVELSGVGAVVRGANIFVPPGKVGVQILQDARDVEISNCVIRGPAPPPPIKHTVVAVLILFVLGRLARGGS